jgi:hypothetical protein
MAAHGDSEQSGTMDISDHIRTWKAFTGLIKWSVLSIAVIMLFLFFFRTHG